MDRALAFVISISTVDVTGVLDEEVTPMFGWPVDDKPALLFTFNGRFPFVFWMIAVLLLDLGWLSTEKKERFYSHFMIY